MHWARLSGSVSGTRFVGAGSLWPALFPPSPPLPVARHCSGTSQVLQGCPTSQVRSSSAYVLRLPDASQGNCGLGRTWDLPVPARGVCVRAYRRTRCCLPLLLTASASRSNCLTRLNTRPARSPVNASTLPLRAAPHDSGPMWVATSHSHDFCIHYTSPV